jgi:hypothetical protein
MLISEFAAKWRTPRQRTTLARIFLHGRMKNVSKRIADTNVRNPTTAESELRQVADAFVRLPEPSPDAIVLPGRGGTGAAERYSHSPANALSPCVSCESTMCLLVTALSRGRSSSAGVTAAAPSEFKKSTVVSSISFGRCGHPSASL